MKMNAMDETLRLLKRFALASLLCLCVTGTLCGGAIVNENSRRMALGETGTQVGWQRDAQTVTFFKEAEAPYVLAEIPLPEPVLRTLRLAPAPLGTLAALAEAVAACAAHRMQP